MSYSGYSIEALEKLSLADLIALKQYLVADRIKHWTDLLADFDEEDAAYQDFTERIQVCKKLRDLTEGIIADRLHEIASEYDI